MVAIDITVYFDTICPWCFIGDRALDKAIDLYQRTYPGGRIDSFNFIHKPYYLNKDGPDPGIPMEEATIRKNGPERAGAIWTRLKRTGSAHGINFDTSGKSGRTRKSHQLIYLAGREYGSELQKRLVEAVYSMHFEQGGDITSVDDLLKAAKAVGLKEEEARGWMEDEAIGRKIDELAAEARAKGVSAVPTLEIGGVRVEGAEELGTMYEALVEARERAQG